jgi:hypothetical protein
VVVDVKVLKTTAVKDGVRVGVTAASLILLGARRKAINPAQ